MSREVERKFGSFDKMSKYLENEINILNKIKHKNIVRLEDFIQTKSNFYLIFEFCEGGDLHKYIRESGPLDEITAQHFLYQIAQAMRQLDINDIMHRDLKPQNILLSENGPQAILKLADFGLAKYSKVADIDEDEGDM